MSVEGMGVGSHLDPLATVVHSLLQQLIVDVVLGELGWSGVRTAGTRTATATGGPSVTRAEVSPEGAETTNHPTGDGGTHGETFTRVARYWPTAHFPQRVGSQSADLPCRHCHGSDGTAHPGLLSHHVPQIYTHDSVFGTVSIKMAAFLLAVTAAIAGVAAREQAQPFQLSIDTRRAVAQVDK